MGRPPLPRHSVAQPSDPSYKIIALTRGQNALVDTSDYEWLTQWNWTAHPRGPYASNGFYAKRGMKGGKTVTMHQMICGKYYDHRNRNGLDNRRSNLRKATPSQQAWNLSPNRNNTSGFKGVYWNNQRGKWMALIYVHWKRIYLGLFTSKKMAAKARDRAARKYHGRFATFNFESSRTRSPKPPQ